MVSKSQSTILVVDDDESIRFMMDLKLRMSGYNVLHAASGIQAVDLIKGGRKIDLMLCDLKMPLKGGIDVIKFLVQNNINLPSVIVTGYPEKEKIREAAKLGVFQIVNKPIRHQELLQIIESRLDANHGQGKKIS